MAKTHENRNKKSLTRLVSGHKTAGVRRNVTIGDTLNIVFRRKAG